MGGCASLRSGKPETPAALDATDTASTRTFLELAAIREDAADWSGALARIDKALAHQPRSRTALLRRAQLLGLVAATGDSTPALDELRAIVAATPEEDADLLLARAWLDTVEGRSEAALAATQRAADVGAEDARTQWMAARSFAYHGDADAALAAADRAMGLDPSSHAARRERARARLRTGEFEGAITDLAAQLRAHGGDLESRALEGEISWRLANYPLARRSFELIPSARRDGATWAALGWIALLADARDAARGVLEAGIAAHPTDARVLDALLALDEREQRVGESLTRLDAAVAVRPTDAALARIRARALAAGHHHDEATTAFGRALTLAPNDAATYDAIAAWLAKAKPEDAERRLAGLGAGVAPTRVATGWLRAARGDRAGMIAAQRQAIEADPSLPIARAALAHALASSGQELDRALTLAREAHAARPHDFDIAWALGVAHLKRGQGEAALEVLGDAIGSYPVERAGYPEILYTAALAFEDIGQREGANRGAMVALAHAGDREPAPAWKAPAKALLGRTAPPPPRAKEVASRTAAPSGAPAAAPTAGEPTATEPAAATPAVESPTAPPPPAATPPQSP